MIIAIIFILLITFGVGLPLVLWIVPKHNIWGRLGLSYLLGIGFFTLIMFVMNIFGFRFSLPNILILLLPVLPLCLFQRIRIKTFYLELSNSVRNTHPTFPEKIMFGVIAFLVVSSFLYTFYWPVSLWDSIVLYDFRAHVFASTGYMEAAFINSYYTSYPLLTSLAHTIVYVAGGKYPQIFDSLFYLTLGLCFYGVLREFVPRKLSLLFVLILFLSSPLFYHSTISYTNLPYAVYLSLGAFYVYLWDKKKEIGYLILSALLVGLSTWTRSTEPFWVAMFLVVFLVSVYRKRFLDVIVYSILFFPIRELWIIFQSSLNGTDISVSGAVTVYSNIFPSLLNVQKWWQVIGYLYKYVVIPWDGIFAAFIISCASLFLVKARRKLFLIFFITFALLSILVVGTFAFSLTVGNWYQIGDAAQRLSMLFYPMFIYCIALVIQESVKIKE